MFYLQVNTFISSLVPFQYSVITPFLHLLLHMSLALLLSPSRWLTPAFCFLLRLRACSARDRRRQGLLHVLCRPGNPSDSCNVSKFGREDEHFRQVPPEADQEVLWDEHHGRVHGKHGNRGLFLLHRNTLHWGRCFFTLRGLEFFPVLLLLLHNFNNNRLRGLCGPPEEQSPPEKAFICGI